MKKYEKYLIGFGLNIIANLAWKLWPKHEAFRLTLLKITSPTGEPEKSPLAFIERYHLGLLSLIIARYTGELGDVLDGFGLGMIASEVGEEKPFGIGKPPDEVRGNTTLGALLTGILLASASR